ncbi:MAG: hypothetical protein Kow009_00220 [Spirochaetales bacterium]
MGWKDRIGIVYQSSDRLIQEKVRSLLFLDTFLCAGFFLLGVIRLSRGMIQMGTGELVISVLFLVFIWLVFRGRFSLVSILNILLVGLAAASLFFMRKISGPNDIYIQATYLIPTLCCLPLLAYALWQVWGLVSFDVVTLTASYLIKVRPVALSSGSGDGLAEYLVALILLGMSSAFIVQIFLLQMRALRELEQRARTTFSQYKKLQGLVEESAVAFNLGENLNEHAVQNARLAGEMRDRLESITERVRQLAENARSAGQSEEKVREARNTVRIRMDHLSESVSQSSNAVEELQAHVKQMVSMATSRQHEVVDLMNTANTVLGRFEQTRGLFQQIGKRSEEILSFVQTIKKIAGSTNLLALNAAIEATHAGKAGKGFAVVADEIRKLAEESNTQAKKIAESLDENNRLVQEAIGALEEFRGVFTTMKDRLDVVKESLTGMLAGMEESADGYRQIEQVIHSLSELHTEVSEALKRMEKELDESAHSIESIEENVGQVLTETGAVSTHADQVMGSARELERIGLENFTTYKRLMDGIRDLDPKK